MRVSATSIQLSRTDGPSDPCVTIICFPIGLFDISQHLLDGSHKPGLVLEPTRSFSLSCTIFCLHADKKKQYVLAGIITTLEHRDVRCEPASDLQSPARFIHQKKNKKWTKSHQPQAFSSNFCAASLCISNSEYQGHNFQVLSAHDKRFLKTCLCRHESVKVIKNKLSEGEASIVCVAGVAGNCLLVAAEERGL